MEAKIYPILLKYYSLYGIIISLSLIIDKWLFEIVMIWILSQFHEIETQTVQYWVIEYTVL